MKSLDFEFIKIRASYLNYFMIMLYAKEGRRIFEKEYEYEGNKPGTVVYKIKGCSETVELAPRWYDIFYLLNNKDKEKYYLSLLIEEERLRKNSDTCCIEELDQFRDNLREECISYVEKNPLHDNENVISMVSKESAENSDRLSINNISHKGSILYEMAQNCYSVPDFCILTSKSFSLERSERNTYLQQAVENLEILTRTKLGDEKNPLIFAIRSALPQYIPGLMPTLLNIGVTRKAYRGLKDRLGERTANRIYLNNLRNIIDLKSIGLNDTNTLVNAKDKELSLEDLREKIRIFEEVILATSDGDELINNAFSQVVFFADCIKTFYDNNHDLIMTFMQGKQAHPSLIMQKMVWTIGNDYSYPGVIHSFHSRTGNGRQVESYIDIFGEEIMTGDVKSEDIEYTDRKDIKEKYPAIFHFDPLLIELEKRFQSPVTIEFAVETRENVSMFAVLQLNKSELTGRSTLISTIELYHKNIINEAKVVDLIRPYHLKQIVSDTIDDKSFKQLIFFGKGVNVLPRTAVTTQICFSSQEAREYKQQGVAVCLCKERFVPEDTIILNEIDAILSLTPAAIHVVTACRGYGIPAFVNLSSYGMRLEGNKLINNNGDVLKSGDWITLSSRRQSIYIGKAEYKVARFMDYLHGVDLKLEEKEEKVFTQMRDAYNEYDRIVSSIKENSIHDINTLAKLIRNDLHERPETAIIIVNKWYEMNKEEYVQQVLESRMGSHQDQSRVYDLLETDKKIEFFKNAIEKCRRNNLSGLNAGSFMLGRFAAKMQDKKFWQKMTNMEIAFILNEYIMYEKYLFVLEDVGETKLTRVHSKIANEGLNFSIPTPNLKTFKSLQEADINWDEVKKELNNISDKQCNTVDLIDRLT